MGFECLNIWYSSRAQYRGTRQLQRTQQQISHTGQFCVRNEQQTQIRQSVVSGRQNRSCFRNSKEASGYRFVPTC